MIGYERAVRFEEVDAAGIVFFGRFIGYAHEAMEAFFDLGVEGGYSGLIVGKKFGFPAVHASIDWKAPLRYGDRFRIDLDVMKVGTTSATLRYTFQRLDKTDESAEGGVVREIHAATIEHVVVYSDLTTMTKRPLDPPIRAWLEMHLLA